jgi:ribonucleoside-diphosphate reductase alpha chain
LPAEALGKGGDEPEAELLPAVKTTGGQTHGPGRPTASAATKPVTSKSKGSNGHHANGSGSNGTKVAASKASPSHGAVNRVDASGVSLLERAGVAPKFEFNLNDGSARGEQFATFQVDAPSCDNCGAITVRNGNCYLCHNCGNSMGCS